jgi:hypothetical protein
MVELFPHQKKLVSVSSPIFNKYGLVYLVAEPRVGKTLSAIFLAKDKYKNILVLTKKSAMSSWLKDLELAQCDNFTVINYDSLHKVDGEFDLLICDEAHSMSRFPKPAKRTEKIKERFEHLPIIFISATPSAESYSQLFHQFWISNKSPYREKNFTQWYKKNGIDDSFIVRGRRVKPYKKVNPNVYDMVKHLMADMSKIDADFDVLVQERVHYLDMPYELKLISNKMQEGEITIDSVKLDKLEGAKKINKLHQVAGGTLKLTDEKSIILSRYKVDYIKRNSTNTKKVVVLCNYIEERKLLLNELFKATEDIDDFKHGDASFFVGHIKKYSEGVDFSYADTMIIYSLNFSATTYLQSKDRLAKKTRKDKIVVHYLIAKNTIDEYVLNAVKSKKNFTSSYYKNIRL